MRNEGLETRLNLFGNDVVRWENDGKQYCLHIRTDEFPENPREWDNVAIMACWHRRYNLGDEIAEKNPEDFWRRLVRENVPESEVYASAEAGRLCSIAVCKNDEKTEFIDIYSTYLLDTKEGVRLEKSLEYAGLRKEDAVDYLIDIITVEDCMALLEPYAEWLPLLLYDHSGLSISCGGRTGQFADRFDSGQVGWIITLKKYIMERIAVEIVTNASGEPVIVEYQHPDSPSTYGYKTIPLTEDTWRKKAVEIMKEEVEEYDQYLTGDVYGYVLYEMGDTGWLEVASCYGFYGCDAISNGIADEVGCGFRDKICECEYETGKAELHTHSYFTFQF